MNKSKVIHFILEAVVTDRFHCICVLEDLAMISDIIAHTNKFDSERNNLICNRNKLFYLAYIAIDSLKYSLLFTHLWNIIMYMYARFDFVVNAITISMSHFVLSPINAVYTIYEWRLLKHCIAGPEGFTGWWINVSGALGLNSSSASS